MHRLCIERETVVLHVNIPKKLVFVYYTLHKVWINHTVTYVLNSNLNSTVSFDCGHGHYLPDIYPEHAIIM